VYKLQRHFAICRLMWVDSINCYPKIKEIEYVLLPENMKKKYKCIDKRMPLYTHTHTHTLIKATNGRSSYTNTTLWFLYNYFSKEIMLCGFSS
jgi:hypothetical protein